MIKCEALHCKYNKNGRCMLATITIGMDGKCKKETIDIDYDADQYKEIDPNKIRPVITWVHSDSRSIVKY